MFTKLKKRVQGEDDGVAVHGASPATSRRDTKGARQERLPSDSSGKLAGRDSVRSSRESLNTEISGDGGSKDELMKALLKRTEQVKKMESRVTELSTILKDRNREIDNLERNLEKQQQENENRIAALNEKYQVHRAKLADGFTLALQKKEEKKEELAGKLEQAEQLKLKLAKQEEENDEVQSFATQELYKVKHMLLLRQKELTDVTVERDKKAEELTDSSAKLQSLQAEVQSLMSQITHLTHNNEKLTKEVEKLTDESITKKAERNSLETCLGEIRTELAQKNSKLRSLEESYTQLQDEHRTLSRNSELSQQKMSTLLEEKDNEIDEQKERLLVLQERLTVNSSECDNERIQGMERERDNLEKKLTETRHQLKEVKTSWSDKITQLETQISHLNRKMAEDSEELTATRHQYQDTQVQLQQQVSDLQNRLHTAEQQAENNLKLANDKDLVIKKQTSDHQANLSKERQSSADLAADFTRKISQLEEQLMQQRRSYEQQISELKHKIDKLEHNEQDWLEKEIDKEKQLSQLDNKIQQYKTENEEKEKALHTVQTSLNDKQQQLDQLRGKCLSIEEDKKRCELELGSTSTKMRVLQSEHQACGTEKEKLLTRNAELSNMLETYKKDFEKEKSSLKQTIKSQATSVAGLEQSVQDMHEEMIQANEKIKLLEKERSDGAKMNDELSKVKIELSDTERQLLDKTKTIKIQQQRLSDLKKTLQRELKVQALPNDEPITQTPYNSRAADTAQHAAPAAVPGHVEKTTFTIATSTTTTTNAANTGMSVMNGSNAPELQVTSTTTHNLMLHNHNGASAKRSSTHSMPLRGMRGDVRGSGLSLQHDDSAGGLTLWQDTNFEYLKHVVLKFVLSRENESLQLIRAIATLLRLSPQEQKLMQDTLEWKTSWFGSRPKLGGGQHAKYIPPSY